jgi:hypothetical protein
VAASKYSDEQISALLDLEQHELEVFLEDKSEAEREAIRLAMNVARGLRDDESSKSPDE